MAENACPFPIQKEVTTMKSILWKVFAMLVVLALGIAMGYAEDSAALYKSKCQMCHGADGKAATPAGKSMGVKDIHSPAVAKMSDAELAGIVKNGKGKMPSYDKKLTDDQIKGLVKYMRSLK
jgi:cytochrome c6